MSDLPRATKILRAGSWCPERAADRLVLPYEERHRRRRRYVGERGTIILLDLPRPLLLLAGDGLALEDGRIIAVEAARETLLKITAEDTATLVRLAWHLGNRHLPAQLDASHILIRDDPVIASMLLGRGARIERVEEPFTPEAGAYGSAHDHDHALAPAAAPAAASLERTQDWQELG